MSANVESLFYLDVDGRHAPWHGLGVRVTDAPTSDDAIVAAGLDWTVAQTPALIKVGEEEIETGDMVNYRVEDKKILGTVSNRYKVVQNKEAFAFTNELIGSDVHYETAGALNGGRTVWLLAQMPNFKVLGDDIESFLLFSNSHDGTSCVRCCVTNVRVVCQNTLNYALNHAQRSWSFSHTGNIQGKVAEAKRTLELAEKYNNGFVAHAEKLARKKISGMQMKQIIDKMFPIPEDEDNNKAGTKIKLEHLIRLRENFNVCYNADDISDFKGTAWGVLNAFSDMIYHGGTVLRKTKTYQEKQVFSAINGSSLLDKAHELLKAA